MLAPRPALPDAPDAAEFRAACEFVLDAWQVAPAAAPALERWAGPELWKSEPPAQRVRDRVTGLRVLAGYQLTINRRLAAALDDAGIPHAQLKGSAVRFSAYDEPEQRVGKDIDLAVPRPLVRRAERVALGQGFVRSQWSPETKRFRRADPGLRKSVEARHYELGFLARRILASGLDDADAAAIERDLPHQYIWHQSPQGLACYVTVDLHHGLSLDVTVDRLVQGATRHDAGEWEVRLPSRAWQLFHLVFKIYWEGVHDYRTGGYQFADVARLAEDATAEDVEELAGILAGLRFEAAGHYVLRRLLSDLGMTLPDHLVDYIRKTGVAPADRKPLQRNDLGDMWPRLWGHL